MRRGLTLIEVLASLVLLSALAAAIAPLLMSARSGGGGGPVQAISHAELADFADRFLHEPGGFGIDSIDTVTVTEKAWPEHPEQPPVVVARYSTVDGEHEWLLFTCGDVVVARFVPRTEETE